MAKISMFLKGQQLRGLAVIRDIGSDIIKSLISHINQTEAPPLSINGLVDLISQGLPEGEKANADIISKLLLSLYNILRQGKFDIDELLEGLNIGIYESEAAWNEEEMGRWKDQSTIFKELLSLDLIWAVVKAVDLSYDHNNFLQDINIITDIRPVFNKKASELTGALVSHSLRIDYFTNGNNESLNIVLDENDIQKLMESCERAFIKGKTIKDVVNTKVQIPTIIVGETDE